MKVLVTGATGFIGSHVIRKICSDNHFNLIAHRRSKNSSPKITLDEPLNWLTKPISELESSDFRDVEVLIHLASNSVQYPFDDVETNLIENVLKPLGMFKKALKGGVKKFIVAGSSFEYGESGSKYEYIPVDAPLLPNNSYSISKVASYHVFMNFAKENNISLHYLRIFQVYGEGESSNRFWPSLRKAAISGADFDMTNGEQVRDFIHVSEVARKIVEEIFEMKVGETLVKNIGSGTPRSLRSFAEYWWKIWKAQGKIRFGAVPYRPNEIMRFVPKI